MLTLLHPITPLLLFLHVFMFIHSSTHTLYFSIQIFKILILYSPPAFIYIYIYIYPQILKSSYSLPPLYINIHIYLVLLYINPYLSYPIVRPIPAWTRLVASLGPALIGTAKVASIRLPPTPRSYDKPIPPEILVLPSSNFRQLLRCCWSCINKEGSDASVPVSRKANILGFFL